MKNGVDISKYQGYLNTGVFLSKDLDFIVLRARNGYLTDSKFYINYKALVDVGYENIEAYGVFYPGLNPTLQADYFYSEIKDKNIKFLWIDVEVNTEVSKDTFVTRLRTYLNRLESLTDLEIGIYTRGNFWNANLGVVSWASEYKLWIARYNLAIDHPWNDDLSTKPYPWDDWDTWQYSADGNNLGHEYGVESDSIDLDRRKRDEENIPPIPPEEEMKKCKSLVNYLRIRTNHNTSSPYYFYMMIGDETEVLEEYEDSISLWYRIGFKQWVAKKYYSDIFLEDI